MGQIQGAGTTVTLAVPFVNGLTLTGEGGFKGAFNHAPKGIVAGNGNEWAFTSVGSTFVAHGHATARLREQDRSWIARRKQLLAR